MEDLPVKIDNYATSAMVHVPLHELDVLRADLMKANSEVIKLKETQKQIIVTHEQGIVYSKSDYDMYGRTNISPVFDRKLIKNSRTVNMDDILAVYQEEYNDKVAVTSQRLSNEYTEALDRETKSLTVRYNKAMDRVDRMETTLHTKYNGDKIELLQSELQHCKFTLDDKLKIISVAETTLIDLQAKIAKYKPAFDTLYNLTREYSKCIGNSVFERFVKGFYIKVDKLLNKAINNE